MNNIITPTFIGHFPNIRVYLESFAKFALKESGWQLVFTISKSELGEFNNLVSPYLDMLPIKVLVFEDILEFFNVNASPEDLLYTYGKFSFQTLKKFYTMLYLEDRYSLVLDSESELVRPTSVNKLFSDFFSDPFISYSSFAIRKRISSFTKNVVANRNYIFNSQDSHWFLENFVWFYDKSILSEIFNQYGSPLQIVEKIRKLDNPARLECGIFEIDFYQSFIFLNNSKYRYRLVNVEHFLDGLRFSEREIYINAWTDKFDGNCGLMEHALMLLTRENICTFTKCFSEFKFNIIRCEKSEFKNCVLQRQFILSVRPNILAASQDHFFGSSECVGINNRYKIKSVDALREWSLQVKMLFRFFVNPLRILFYFLKSEMFKMKLRLFKKALSKNNDLL